MAQPSFESLLEPHLEGAAKAQMAAYAGLLERWSARHNLVRWRDRRELVERHLVEALAGCSWLGERGLLADVGSGAGLPGVPLLIASPGWRGELMEPRQKRWAFLRLVIRELGLQAVVRPWRFEDDKRPEVLFDAVTVRALALSAELLTWTRARLAPGGRALLWTTHDGEQRLREEAGWRVLSSPLSSLEHGRLVSLEPCFT